MSVNRANIERDTAIQRHEDLLRNIWIAGHFVRTSIYFLVNFGVFGWLYLVQC